MQDRTNLTPRILEQMRSELIELLSRYVELDKEALIRILKEPKNALIKQYKKIFELDGIDLEFTDDALDVIVGKTIENKIGARGLRGTMENIMNTAMFNMPSENIKKLVVDKDYVKQYIN